MPIVHESIRINRPVQEVFEFVTTPQNQMLYSSNLVEFEADGPLEKGTRSRGTTKVAGRRIEWTSEVTEFDPFRSYRIRSIEAPMSFTVEWTFEDAAKDATDVTFHQEVDELGGFFGKLADPLVTAMYAHDVRSNLHQLKELLEHQG